jgi:asparagine synthase (glutamine-hydrolysing)
MPGICAIISNNMIRKDLISSMIKSLKREDFHIVDQHYSEHFAGARIHLGIFNPLKQPLFNKDKSICAMMDGKIYGHSGRTDLEYCLESYERYGVEFIQKLNGNFVLLIQDFRNNKTIIANDRFAFRTHYYALHNGSLFLAPEPKAILQNKTFKKEIDDEGLISFLSFGDFLGGRSLFKGIHVIEPASIITFDGEQVSVKKYWRLTYNSDYSKTDEEFVKELVESFKHAVKIRTEDALRYSVTLSGGLDSRTVLSTLVLEKRSGVNAITWGNQECTEAKIAKQVTRKLGVKNHMLIDITPELILQYAEKEVFLSDGHSYVGEGYAYPVIKEVKKITDVILDGFALDLTLGGSYLTPDKVSFKGTDFLSQLLNSKPYVRYFYANNNLKRLLTPEYYKKIKDIPFKLFKAEYDKIQSKEYGNKCDEFAMNVHVAYTQVGDITVRNFVEVTHPTADNDLVDILLTIPPEKRLHHMIYRKFLKRIAPSMARIPYNKTMVRPDRPIFLWNVFSKYDVGKAILRNKIRRYTRGRLCSKERRSYVNFFQWFQTNENWQGFFNEILVENPPKNNLFNNDYVRNLLKEQISGARDNVRKLLYLTTIYMFLRNWFGEKTKNKKQLPR